ncbi:UNVERIFIED_CONTAM: hypothetical protein FKN15_021194 [Acipenser sinensis]
MDSCVITELDQNCSDYHFVMTGKTYDAILRHFHSLLPKLLLNGTVFARMSPGQKTSLVEEFQRLEFVVGMCGDGANDCGALKMAHAGISLSEQDASVASPFTSKIPNIECVPLLIREGRAALVTSYCMFKYMALYSMSQYLGVLLLYWQLNSFGNYQFLFEDLAINTVIGFTMNLNHAHPKLAPRWPPAQLMSPPMLLSVVLNVILSLALQTAGFLAVQQQAWYLPNDIYSACTPGNASSSAGNRTHNSTLSVPVPDPGFKSYENTTVWLLSLFSCITVAFIFSRGKPFRKAIYTNYLFVLVLLSQLAVCLFFLFADVPRLYQFMDCVCVCVFLGLLILENRLKPETRQVLQELSSARIRSVMVTGDNLETAVTVANNSGMVQKTSRVIQVESAPPSGSNPASVTWRLLEEPKHNCSTIQLNSFGNYQFLFEDLAINTVIGFTMNLNHAHPKLAPRWPPAQLMSPPMLLSVVLNVILSLVLQTAGFLAVQQQAWYLPNDIYRRDVDDIAVPQVQCPVLIGRPEDLNQVPGLGVPRVLSSEDLFVLVLLSQLAVCLFFLFADVPRLYQFMDEFIIENRTLWWWLRRCSGVQSQTCYRKLQRALEKEAGWPPLSGTQYAGCSMAFDNTAFEEHRETGH